MCKKCEPLRNGTPYKIDEFGNLVCENCDRLLSIDEQASLISDYLDEIETEEQAPATYDRITQWMHFSDQVYQHIEQYTLPQYENKEGDDQATHFTVEECFNHMMRYINRRKANVRGNKERLRDLLKIAHYACFAYDKLRDELNEEDVYNDLG